METKRDRRVSGFWAALKEFTGDSGEAGHVLLKCDSENSSLE